MTCLLYLLYLPSTTTTTLISIHQQTEARVLFLTSQNWTFRIFRHLFILRLLLAPTIPPSLDLSPTQETLVQRALQIPLQDPP